MQFLYSFGLALILYSSMAFGELRGKDNRDHYFRNFLNDIPPDVFIELSLSVSGPSTDPIPPPHPVPPVAPPTPVLPVAPPASVLTVTPPTPVTDDLIAQNIELPEADCPCLFPDSDKGCCYLPDWACKPGERSCSNLLPDLPIVPVCGCDGKTYLNPCIALVENCLHCWTYGPCIPTPPVPPVPPTPPVPVPSLPPTPPIVPPTVVPPEPPVAISMPWYTGPPTAVSPTVPVPPTPSGPGPQPTPPKPVPPAPPVPLTKTSPRDQRTVFQ